MVAQVRRSAVWIEAILHRVGGHRLDFRQQSGVNRGCALVSVGTIGGKVVIAVAQAAKMVPEGLMTVAVVVGDFAIA